jgi:hypothetical protein
MRVKELITLLLDQDLDDEVFIDCSTTINPNNRVAVSQITTRYSSNGVFLDPEYNLQTIEDLNT